MSELRRLHLNADDAFSLVELLVTIVIVGVTFAALLGGITTSMQASALQRRQAAADAIARSAAEWVKDSEKNPYEPCPATHYSLANLPIATGDPQETGDLQATIRPQVEYATVQNPVPNPFVLSFQTACPSVDPGIERATIDVRAPDGSVIETVQVIKRAVP